MKIRPVLLIIPIIFWLSTTTWLYLHKDKTAYVELASLYNEFALKKELAIQFDALQQNRQYQIDSLKLSLASSYKQLQASQDSFLLKTFEKERQLCLFKQQRFEDEKEKLLQQYENQIWTQLNQYIIDYGEQHSYDYIYGANGDGNVMFANPANDISLDVLQYVNERYHGKIQ